MACSEQSTTTSKTLKTGYWRALLEIQGQQLPFVMEVTDSAGTAPEIYVLNGEERILLDEISYHGDSVKIGLHKFDADITSKIEVDLLIVRWEKNDTP
ncbi:MAG: hypothetical protein LPK19_04390 [Hymenobacteraceae bacterium]|nr:hypothetical protein [Hymenobacteraceae bacterium]MDX5395435.1 hypothetical protein [Hymenobacteraceae bacterium]MDX5511484.1 hypothetical protein [Hymenobacteraceae bacterium]